jgi:hypothetical protein
MEDKKEKPKPPSYSFSVSASDQPAISRVIVTASVLASSLGLGSFAETDRIGTVSCTISRVSLKTNIQVASLFYNSSTLCIVTTEKLRPEFAVRWAGFMAESGWIKGQVVVFDSIYVNDFVGRAENKLQTLATSAFGHGSSSLEPGNSLKGASAAVLMACEAQGISAVCYVGVHESYELCEENAAVFNPALSALGLVCDLQRGVNKAEQLKPKHQIYS